MKTKVLLFILLLGHITACAQEKPEFEKPLNILVFSKTAGFRHGSISSGLKMLFDLSKKQNWIITATENSVMFNDVVLNSMDVAVFLNPTGDALNSGEQAAFEKWMSAKKGFVGIHAAADFEYNWPFYGNLVGGYFKTHPPTQKATVIFEKHNHPAMKPFEGMKSYTSVDEWYSFKENPRTKVNVLAALDETTITKFDNDNWRMGDHPIIWWSESNRIRSFYTGYGHTDESFQDEKIKEHIKNAINWAGMRLN